MKSDATLNVGYLAYEFPLPCVPVGNLLRWEAGPELAIRVMHGAAAVESGGVSGSETGTVATPVLGGHVAVEFAGIVRADLEVVGLKFSYSGHRASYLEACGEIVAAPVPWFFAGAGYKYVALRAKIESGSDDFDLRLRIPGFYLTAGVRF